MTHPAVRLLLPVALGVSLCLGSARAQEPAPQPATGPEQVTVGVYVSDVMRVDLKAHSYEVNFYVWFRWRNRELSPHQTIEFVNTTDLWGLSVTPDTEEPIELPSGELYQVLRVQGLFSRKLPLYSYPFDRQTLVVDFEDTVNLTDVLVHVPDAVPVKLDPELTLPGYEIGEPALTVGPHRYPTSFGDTRFPTPGSFSRVRLEIPITRPFAAYALKLLLPVLCVVLTASLMFLLPPGRVDALVGIGITALLTVVALQITTNEELPDVAYLIFMDKVYIGAYVYIIAGLGQVVRATQLMEKDGKEQALRLQRRGLIALTGLFLAAVLALTVQAMIAG
ncbi:MAG: hypothetical protein KDD82_00280 [Planctomycetes bacterium]|nr:hypothetical protein [Planctomycetota bacterium]